MNPFFDQASSATDDTCSNGFLNQSSVGLVDSSLHLNVCSSESQFAFPSSLPPKSRSPPPPSLKNGSVRPSLSTSNDDGQGAMASASIIAVGERSTAFPPLATPRLPASSSVAQWSRTTKNQDCAAAHSDFASSSVHRSLPASSSSMSFSRPSAFPFPSAPSFSSVSATCPPYRNPCLDRFGNGSIRQPPRPAFFHPDQPGVNFFQSPLGGTNRMPWQMTPTMAAERPTEREPPPCPPIDLIISNVVAVCSVRCHLDLHSVCMKTVNVIYHRDRNVAVMKLRSPRVTCRVWSSGKITCTGADCEEDAKKGCRRVARILSKLGYKVRFSSFRVVNILAAGIFPFAVRLIKLAKERAKDVYYEPEIHPGAALRFRDLKVNARVFSTGSVTVTAPKIPLLQEGVLRAYKMVYDFRNEEEDKNVDIPGRTLRSTMSLMPLLSQFQVRHTKAIPKGPFHSRYKQLIHREQMLSQAFNQVRTTQRADDYLLSDVYDSDSDFSD